MVRSIKTLGLRTLRHGLNALRIADWLAHHPAVEDVRYPGLKTSDAFHLVEPMLSTNARKELEFLGWQFPFQPTTQGQTPLDYIKSLGIPFGGVITFRLRDADEEATDRFVTSLRLILLAESLGGVESLIEVPYGMTHSGLPAETRAALGITPNLVRFSVGIEDADDLIADLEAGFKALHGGV